MKKILMVGCGDIGRLAMMELEMPGVEIVHITPEQAKETGLILVTDTEPPPPYKLTHIAPLETLFIEPQTRKERRKQKRAKRKKRK